MPTAAHKISQEVWDMIADYLPALSARYAALALNFRLRPQQKKQAGIWDAIFQDLTWVSEASNTGCGPVLIGKDLSGDNLYLVLLAKPFESRSETQLFLRSLKDHHVHNDDDNHELEFTSGVTLNVAHLYRPRGKLPVRITKLLERHKRVRTAFMFWQGRSIDSTNLETIVGAKGMGYTLKSFVGYRLTLNYLDDTRVQYRFKPQTQDDAVDI